MTNETQNGVNAGGLEKDFSNMSVQGGNASAAPKKRYVPPHMRNQPAGVTPPPSGGRGGASSLPPAFSSGRGRFSDAPPTAGGGGGGGGRWSSMSAGGGSRRNDGFGSWKDGKHMIGPKNDRMELDLFGEVNDGTTQGTGINFDKYGDIPVEATGNDVPEPITEFTHPPVDEHLISNLSLIHI